MVFETERNDKRIWKLTWKVSQPGRDSPPNEGAVVFFFSFFIQGDSTRKSLTAADMMRTSTSSMCSSMPRHLLSRLYGGPTSPAGIATDRGP